MKKRRGHEVPLSSQALAVLDIMHPISSQREYVFPGRNDPQTHINREAMRMAFNRLKINTTAHGLRALASTIMNESGLFDADTIEVALSHVDKNKVRAAYNRAEYLKQRRELMKWWGAKIDMSSFVPSL